MTLRLVRPPHEGQGRRPRRGALTAEEHRNLGAAIRYLSRTMFGTTKRLARETGIPLPTLSGASKGRWGWGSAGIALAIARASGTTVEEVLSGRLVPPTCPHCGAERRSA